MNALLNDIIKSCAHYTEEGAVANYIPELAKADPSKFGIYVLTHFGQQFSAGDCNAEFTMQSVIKPLILLMALFDSGIQAVHDLVGVEATGKPFDAFNYSDQALTSANINPMINTGSIALCTLIKGDTYRDKFDRLLEFTRKIAANPNMDIDEAVYASEKATGNKNRALGYMLKAYGMINDNIEDVVDCYFRACSVKATCADLARIASVFSNKGKDILTGEQLFDPKYCKYVNAILMTCGMYDGSGEFALRVGFPAKSGVGGGIMGVVPGKMGIGVFSPALDCKGNSLAGVNALEILSRELDLSVFL
ncbi:MAG: glutaminase A [Oscillospiraceae bacterium]|nr:glutaminase A [Oscillospiraceae bacterium]